MSDDNMIRDRSGELRPDTTDQPRHHWRCDGVTGRTPAVNWADRLPVACVVCRPHLRVGAQRDGRLPVVTLGR